MLSLQRTLPQSIVAFRRTIFSLPLSITLQRSVLNAYMNGSTDYYFEHLKDTTLSRKESLSGKLEKCLLAPDSHGAMFDFLRDIYGSHTNIIDSYLNCAPHAESDHIARLLDFKFRSSNEDAMGLFGRGSRPSEKGWYTLNRLLTLSIPASWRVAGVREVGPHPSNFSVEAYSKNDNLITATIHLTNKPQTFGFSFLPVQGYHFMRSPPGGVDEQYNQDGVMWIKYSDTFYPGKHGNAWVMSHDHTPRGPRYVTSGGVLWKMVNKMCSEWSVGGRCRHTISRFYEFENMYGFTSEPHLPKSREHESQHHLASKMQVIDSIFSKDHAEWSIDRHLSHLKIGSIGENEIRDAMTKRT